MKRKLFVLTVLFMSILITNSQRSRTPPHGKAPSFQPGTAAPPPPKGVGMGDSTKNC